MVRTPQQMQLYRQHRLELILLGMAIAKEGDRDKVIENVTLADLQSPLVATCLQAVKTLDAEDVADARNVFKQWGLKVGASVSQSLIAAVNVNNARRRLSQAVDEATAGDAGGVNEAIEEVEVCLQVLKDMQKVSLENGVSA